MRYGISLSHVARLSPSVEELLGFAREAENVGFNSIVVSDHVFIPDVLDASVYPAGTFMPEGHWYDPFVALAAIAGVTKTMRLGTGVAVVPYRPPVQQAQAVATLDFMSGGRCFYGVGIGWMREESDALGLSFAERGRRTDEYLEVIKLVWSGEGSGYHGEFIEFNGGRISPLPTQRPHPPIIVGGETPPALRRIARHGDGFYMNWKTLPEFSKVLRDLGSVMANTGRLVSDLHTQLAAPTIELLRAEPNSIADYEALGLTEIIYAPQTNSVAESLDAMREFADEFIGSPLSDEIKSVESPPQ